MRLSSSFAIVHRILADPNSVVDTFRDDTRTDNHRATTTPRSVHSGERRPPKAAPAGSLMIFITAPGPSNG
ncbi:hypothetical protein GCM10009779_62190 [Polymorphospora rubra]|uniref:Uncharacterized protein n=1 Tax=Polymorphospora rubra TaxID=338584 RepID=A0A810MUT6_9ACTN|nr:hypothetical protein [Polymorphospora rubra]BCJ64966.1 hypothetical protein Prubr_19870 [Polymorphospora rubra]